MSLHVLVQTIIKNLTLKENLLKNYLKNTENIDIYRIFYCWQEQFV